MERLDKIISATGKKSRREVREMVRQGRVLVDGKPAPAADMKVDPQTAVILLDGEPLGYEKFTYVMLHKPAGLEILSPTEALVTLREGKFHQVKRMLAARGKPVLYLKRLSMGRLRLDPALAPGAWRMLTEEERSALNLSLSETLLDRTTKNEERIL